MPTTEDVEEKLKEVMDPETGTDVYTMGLVSDLEVEGDSVSLTFTPSSPFCPLGVQLAVQIKEKLTEMESLDESDIDVTVQGHMNEDEINEKLSSGG